jgi:lysophospholipase L1-like esterase
VLVEDLTAYVEATKKVGAEEYVTVIDLNQMSMALLKKMNQAEADKFDKGNDPETGKLLPQQADAVSATATGVDAVPAAGAGKVPAMDRTHLNPYGQKVFGRMVADQIVKTRVELGPDLIGEPAPFRAGTPAAGAGGAPPATPFPVN